MKKMKSVCSSISYRFNYELFLVTDVLYVVLLFTYILRDIQHNRFGRIFYWPLLNIQHRFFIYVCKFTCSNTPQSFH